MKIAVRRALSCVVGLFAIAVFYLALTGKFSAYVNPRFFWLLILAGLVLATAVIGSSALLRLPKIAFILLVPLALIWIAEPGQLGASMARQQSLAPLPAGGTFPALSPGLNQVGMRELNARSRLEPESTIGAEVAVMGFAVAEGENWRLARFTMSCCAADAVAYFADLDLSHWSPGIGQGLKEDKWYTVYATVDDVSTEHPVLSVSRIESADVPGDPYEY